MAEVTSSGNDLDMNTHMNLTTEFESTSTGVFLDEITEKPYQDLVDRTYLCLGILSLVLIPFLFGGNFLVLLSLFIFRKLRSIQNLFIGCLASFDLLLSITSLPTYVVGFWFSDIMLKSKYLCIFKYATVVLSCIGSLLSVFAIAVDRYIAVLYPLKYPLKMTKNKAKKIMAVIWICTITLGVIPFFWNNAEKESVKCEFTEILPWTYVILAVFVSIPVAIIPPTILYIRIFRVAIRQKKKMLDRRSRFDPERRRLLEKNTKSASVMAMVLFFFFVFWFPFMVVGGMKFLRMDENLYEVIKSITFSIAQSNSGVNPVIYCFLKPEFRIAFKLIFGRMRGKGKLNRDACLSENMEGINKLFSNTDDVKNDNFEMKVVVDSCPKVTIRI